MGCLHGHLGQKRRAAAHEAGQSSSEIRRFGIKEKPIGAVKLKRLMEPWLIPSLHLTNGSNHRGRIPTQPFSTFCHAMERKAL